MAVEQRSVSRIERSDMTPVMDNTDRAEMEEISESNADVDEDVRVGDIPVTDITGNVLGTGNLDQVSQFPVVLPNNPIFKAPANPLLPDEYSELLDYNSIQYMNGIFRTQIVRYVRVQQLVGSNTTEDQEGFLIGVGINYIILQDYSDGNIRIIDIYGIKNMYVYYAEITNQYDTDR